MKSHNAENGNKCYAIVTRNYENTVQQPEIAMLIPGDIIVFLDNRGFFKVQQRNEINEKIAHLPNRRAVLIAEATTNVIGASLVLEEQQNGSSILLNINLEKTYDTISTGGYIFEGVLGTSEENARSIKSRNRQYCN